MDTQEEQQITFIRKEDELSYKYKNFNIQIWILKKNNWLHSLEKKMFWKTVILYSFEVSSSSFWLKFFDIVSIITNNYQHYYICLMISDYFEICQFSIRFFYKWWMVSGFLTEYFENLLYMSQCTNRYQYRITVSADIEWHIGTLPMK